MSPRHETVTVHIENVPWKSILDALIAIEVADARGMFDQVQHDRLTALVLGLRRAMDQSLIPATTS